MSNLQHKTRLLTLSVLVLACFAALNPPFLLTQSVTYAQTETLAAPTLTAQAAAGAVQLNWTEVEGAARYDLLTWNAAATGGWQRISDRLTGTSYTHENLTAGTTYYYAVSALDANGVASAYSEQVSATVPAAPSTPLQTPTLTAQAAAGAVQLNWTEVEGAARYDLLTWNAAATGGWQRISDRLTGTSYTHENLTAGTTYYYAVSALDANGVASAYSEHVSATVPAAPSTPLQTPTLTAQAAAGAVQLNWTEVEGAARYDLLTWNAAATGGWQRISDRLTGTSYTHENLTAGTTYYYAVSALDANGVASAYSEHVSATVPAAPSTPLQTPTLTAQAAAGAVQLNWTEVEGAARYDLLTWNAAATGGWQRISDRLTGTSYTHENLTAGTTYYYAVSALDANGVASAYSEQVSAIPTTQGLTSETDRTALVALYNATGGPNWTNNTNWLSDKSIGEWYGVTTDDNGRVTALDLLGNRLSGSIPTQLGNLSKLTDLTLSFNGLSGSIPTQLGNLSNLTTLKLFGNRLSGSIPAQLGNLSKLTDLTLTGNQLSGTIPAQLGNLSNLTYLSLSYNQLSGSIPTQLGNLSKLQTLYLEGNGDGNGLSGSIPTELGNLSNLTGLSLADNQLSGSIPTELGNLSNLTGLSLSRNQLSGSIPTELGNLSKLTFLSLYNNQLSGSIPTQLGNLSKLTFLSLSGNQLSGSIPTELGNLSNLTDLFLYNNQLSGSIPAQLGNLSKLTDLSLSYNQLSGSIPTQLGNLSKLTFLSLSGNQLSGSIPTELGNLSNLTDLFLSGNQLSGCIPAALLNLKVPNNDLNNLDLEDCST